MGARPAVAVIENLVAGRRQQNSLRSRLVVASARAIRAPPSETARRRRITSSIALSVGRNDAVLYDFDEVSDYYFNKLTQTFCFVTPLGRRN